MVEARNGITSVEEAIRIITLRKFLLKNHSKELKDKK